MKLDLRERSSIAVLNDAILAIVKCVHSNDEDAKEDIWAYVESVTFDYEVVDDGDAPLIGVKISYGRSGGNHQFQDSIELYPLDEDGVINLDFFRGQFYAALMNK